MKPLRLWFGLSLLALFTMTVWSDAQSKKDPKTVTEEPTTDPTEEEAKEQAIADRFRKVLDTNPRRGTALDRLYGYHVERGTLEKLIGEYSARAKSDAKDGKAWLVVGLLEAQRGKDAAAVAAFRKAEELLTDNAIPSYYLGQSLVLVGQPEKAAEAFERAITRKPNRNDLLDIFQALGRVYQRSQRSEKALDVWNRLEKLYPDDLRVQEQIATTLVEEGEYAQALPRLEKLAKTTEDSYRQASLKMEIADLKVRLKRTPEALADFEKLTADLNPESWLYRDVRRRIEDVFLKNDDLAGLAKYYEKWLEKNPTDVDAVARLAKNLSSQGRAAEARKWLEKGIAVAPSNRGLRQALIDQYAYEQNFALAAQQYELMDKNDPNNPDILRDWGRLLMRDTAKPDADRRTAASAVWKKILDKKPKDPVVTSQVADLLRQAGITDDAIALYKRAIELAPDAAQYREYLGEYFHSLKRSEEALATWRPIAEGNNRNSKNLNRLAEVFAGFGYRKEAIETMSEAIKLESNDFTMRMTFADFLHADSRNDDAVKEIEAAKKFVSNPEETEQVLLAEIKIFQATEKLGDQITQLQKELDMGREPTGERYLRLARFYEANRQPELATEAIAKAAEKDPKSIPILIAAARIHEAGGNMLAASDTNRKLAALDRRFRTEYLQAVAKLEQRLGRREQAMQAGRDLLAASPGNPDVYKFFADLCFQLGDQEEGLEALRRSVRANPSEPSGLITLANALVERLRQGEAIELLWRAFEKTNELEGRLSLIDKLAQLYLENNQFDKLVERLEREKREAEKAREFSMCLAQAFQTAGDLGTARGQLERLLTENTRDGGLLDQLTQLCEKEGDVGSALKYQRQLVAAQPNNTDHQLKMAQLLTRTGEADEAADIWIKLSADAEPHRNLNAIDQLINAQKFDSALAILTRLLAQKPGNWELIYREGAVLAAKNNREQAGKRFEAILGQTLADDELGEQAKNAIALEKKKAKMNPKAAAIAALSAPRRNFDENLVAPLSRRLQSLYEIQTAVGLNPDNRYYGPGQGPRFWVPGDFGEARMASTGWLYEFARVADLQEPFVKKMRTEKDKPGTDDRAKWDFYYLQLLRGENKELTKLSLELSKAGNPAGYLAFLSSLEGRGDPSNRNRRAVNKDKADKTPPLPPDQLSHALECYRKLRAIKPEWVERGVATTILLELKRAKNDAESKVVYQSLIADANTVPRVMSVMGVAAERDDPETVSKLFEKLQKLQGPPQVAGKLNQLPTRQVAQSFVTVMGKQTDAKKFEDSRKTLDAYLAAIRKENLSAPRSMSQKRSNQGAWGMNLYSQGNRGRYQQINYPSPNEYYDQGCLQLLYNAFDLHKKADLLSDLHAHFRKQIDQATGADKLYLHLALGYLYWWGEEKELALDQMTFATQSVPGDHNLLLEVAALREQNNEFAAALELLDSISPLDHQMMQRREEAAMRVAERTGNVERARESANRLFGMRLDADKQLELAGKMHRLGLHEMAETVLARSHRQAGNNTQTLLRLMNQYQSQNQGDLAVAIARQILRKAPTTVNSNPRFYDEENNNRNQAVGVLARSGQLKELIERSEAQLKASPKSIQIHQQLLDYYRAAGEKEKQKEVALKMVELKPDDGKFRYSMAQQLMQLGDNENAMKQYVEAIKRDPSTFQYSYWEVERLFSQAGKYEELSKLMDEIDLRKLGQPYYVTNVIQSLSRSETGQQLATKLFKKAWAAFPTMRGDLLSYIGEQQMRQLPEIYDFLREAIIPRPDTESDPWSVVTTINNYGQDGKVTSVVGQMLSIARKQFRLGELRKEVETALAAKSDWHAGRALLAIIDVQTGKKEEGLKALEKLFEEKKAEVPGMARFILTQELEFYAGAEDTAVRILEAGVDDILDSDNQTEFEHNPVRRLVWWYQQLDRPDDARKLLTKISKFEPTDPGYGGGYWQYRQINQKMGVAQAFVKAGDPVEAIKLYSDILAKPDDIVGANQWYGGGNQMEQMVETGFKAAVKALKPDILPAAMKGLLTPREEKGRPALDLVVVVEARELSKAKIGSIFQTALKATEKTPELRKEVFDNLASLATKFPSDFSVQTASALGAFQEAKPEVIDAAVERLAKLIDSVPLEALPPEGKANARQRDEARQQIALWFVARECLQKDREKYAVPGRKIAGRALDAAKRQNEPIFAQAILREWGELEVSHGDKAQGEARWAEMLQMMLPKPGKKKKEEEKKTPTAPVPTPVPVKGDNPLTMQSDGFGDDDERKFVLFQAPPAKSAPVAPAAAAPSGDATVLNMDQFQQIFEYAKVAADKKLAALSMKAMKEALKGGPPLPSKNQNRGGGYYSTTMIGGVQYYVLNDGTNRTNPDTALTVMVPKWRAINATPAEIYDVLAAAVFPDARPAEVFLSYSNQSGQSKYYTISSTGSLQPVGYDPVDPGEVRDLSRLLARTAVEAKKEDDLRKKCESRLSQPIGELQATIMLFLLAIESKDDAKAADMLKKLAERIQKDTLQTTLVLVSTAATYALERPVLETAAEELLLKVAMSYATANNPGEASSTGMRLIENKIRKGDKAGAKILIDLGRTIGKTMAANDTALHTRLGSLYLRAGYVEDALSEFALHLDALTSAKIGDAKVAERRQEPTCDGFFQLYTGLLELPPAKRYEVLKNWTLPTAKRKSLRYYVGTLPKQLPPPAFVKLPPLPADPIVSTLTLFIDTAKEANKADELLAAADKAVADKIENADAFRALAYLAVGKGKMIEEEVKKYSESIFKRLTDKPVERVSSRYYYGEEQQQIAYRPTEYLFARLCSNDPNFIALSEKLAEPILEKSGGAPPHSARVLQSLNDSIILRRHAAPEAAASGLPTRWHNAKPNAVWLTQDGLLTNLFSDGNSRLLLDVPLTGTYEWSVDLGPQAAYAGSNGIQFNPAGATVSSTLGVGEGSEQAIYKPAPGVRASEFNRLTVRVTPKKVTCLVNGKVWFEDADPAPTCPWAMLGGEGGRPVFRDFALTGTPEIPTEVKLLNGDYLEGWIAPFRFTTLMPNRIVARDRKENPNRRFDRYGRPIDPDAVEDEPVAYDWEAKDGVLTGKRIDKPTEQVTIPNHVAYFRPLRAGETVSYEFFRKPGESHADPCLGQLRFVLDPDGVKWNWIVGDGDNPSGGIRDDEGNVAAAGGHWLPLKPDQTVTPPAEYKPGPSKLPFKDGDWNAVKLGITDKGFRLELNGTLIHEGPLPTGVDTRFGLFHFRNRTEAKIRNAVLTGDWPKKLEGNLGFVAKPISTPAAKARRELIGERNYAMEATDVLERASKLAPEEKYRLLTGWILPTENRPVFQFGGAWKSDDVLGVVDQKKQPDGKRVLPGGRFESPVLELVKAASELKKLDELAQTIDKIDTSKADDHFKRCKTAMQVLTLAAQGKDVDAAPKLAELKTAVEAMSPNAKSTPRWPVLLACLGTIDRESLAKPATDLADAMCRNIEKSIIGNQTFEDRDWWFRVFRFVRAQGQLRDKPEQPFAHWTATLGINPGHRAGVGHKPRWRYADDTLTHYPGHGDDYLILNSPLRGDFELTCDLLLQGWQECFIRYGGYEVRLDSDRKSYKLSTNVAQEGRKTIISPPLKDQKSTKYAFTLSVKDGSLKCLVDGSPIFTEKIGPNSDPWLMIRCNAPNTGEVKNLKISGSPSVPEKIGLTDADEFPMWRVYQGNGVPTKRGEEMYHFGGKNANFDNQQPDEDEPVPQQDPRAVFTEAAYFYQRPLAEDGSIEYEFYYSPDKALVHPALDRLVFLLEPTGVKLHWLTDGALDRSGLTPTNSKEEPDCRRGPEKLPLKPKAWNKVRLQLTGDTLKLSLNGTEVYERGIESTNQRLFGLFHYFDKTELRVRGMVYEGKWERELPAGGKLFE